MKLLLPSPFICILLLACNNIHRTSTTQPAPLSEMKVNKSDGWGGDITLNIGSKKTTGEITTYKILSAYQNKPVGFWMEFKRPKDKKTLIWSGITFKPMGDTSNNFLTALADVYQINPINGGFTDSVSVTYADLENMYGAKKPGDWIAAQGKLFFPDDEDNAELYLDIDEQAHTVVFSEKDSSYRKDIIQAFTKHGK
jgi:hypothetical protein